ncbi:hypothetical protein D3C86_1717410 [compost metagenome]
MLIKNAIITGMMMSFPMTKIAPARTIPRSSIDLFTVSGMSFIRNLFDFDGITLKGTECLANFVPEIKLNEDYP